MKESPAGKTSLSKISSSFRTSFRDSGMKISGISAARRRIPPALRLRCREATAREGHCGGAVGFVLEVVAGQGRLKVARGRSWQPEIGMEHASRGRRSGNKGVGARWRGRFRIFSERHCSRTKVSHAENSGMTMLFFSWRLLRCRRGILSHAREWSDTHAATECQTTRGVLVWGILSHAREWSCGAVPPQERRHEGGWFFGAVPPQERRHEGGWFFGAVPPQERRHEGATHWFSAPCRLRRDGTR